MSARDLTKTTPAESGRAVAPAAAPAPSRAGALLREMFMGADESAPPRPGRYLETPQRLGILPTLHFWNRRDVWQSGRWVIAPVAGASALFTGLAWTVVSPSLVPLVGLASGVPVILAHGLLERYVRRRLRERARARGPASRLPPRTP